MRAKPIVSLVIILGAVVFDIGLGPGSFCWAQSKEKLLFKEIPVVITAARREQPIAEAPVTVTVITAEDIRYSGATTLPDLLRMVAGVDVMTITARDQQVAVRGFISSLSNKLPVLIDGRSVYEDPFGNVYWDSFSVGLHEIDRIEVVKSPASSLYGANAYSGIINIITQSPSQLKGTTLHLTAGTRNTLIGSLIHAGEAANKKIRYKISAEWEQNGEWGENKNEDKAGESTRVNGQLEYRPNNKIKLALSGGRSNIKKRKIFLAESVGTGQLSNTIDYLRFDFEYDNLKCRTFYKQTDAENIWSGEEQSWRNSTFDAELVHSFQVGNRHSLVWGINFRHDRLGKNSLFPEDHRQDLWALFLDDEITISKHLRLTLGGRYDRHPLTRSRFSPRGNLFYSPTENHILRFSVAQAFRSPTFTTSFIYYDKTYDIPLTSITYPLTFILQGNPLLKPEDITSYEIGYHGHWSRHLKVDMNLFYNQYADFIRSDWIVIYYDENELYPGLPGGTLPKAVVLSYQNGGAAWGIGGEIHLEVSVNQWIGGFLNYSFLQITDKDDNIFTDYVNEKNRIRTEYPTHKINANLRILFKNGFSLNFLGHWVANTQRFITDSELQHHLTPVPAYFIFNTLVSYTFWKEKAEVALSVFNLFNDNHYEYPTDMSLPIPNSRPIGRRIAFTLRIKF